ncbi:MAG TPA: ATP-binding protein [Chloroflexota bacterium]|nr:ATP-binding protein [Chloroflexota bacterium]
MRTDLAGAVTLPAQNQETDAARPPGFAPARAIWNLVGLRIGDDPRIVMAKVSIWLHWLAALLALLLMAIPPTNLALVAHITPLAAMALLFTLVLHRFPWERFQPRMFVVTSFLDMGLIALGVAFSGAATSRYALLFFLIVVFAAYFYTIRDAAIVTAATTIVLSAPLVYGSHHPAWIVPLIACAGGVMVMVAAVTKQTVTRVEHERVRRDELEAERNRMYEQEVHRRTSIQQKTRQLESILEMGNAFRLQLGLDALLEKIASAIGETGGFRAVVVRLFDPETGAALCKAAYGIEWDIVSLPTPPELIKSLMDEKYQVSRSYLVQVEPEALEHPETSPYYYVRPDSNESTGDWRPTNTLIVPLETRDHGLIGIISIDEPLDGKIPSIDTIQTLEIFANLAATAIDNARLLVEASQAQALRELDRLKSEFLAAVSHDLRTPLTVIKGSVDLLDTHRGELSDLQAKLIDGIARNTRRLMDMVEQLLEMIQLQHGRIVLHRQLVDVREIVVDTVEAMAVAAATRDQRITIQAAPKAVHLVVDRSRIQQVLTNLIGNACKYGPEREEIVVSVDESTDELRLEVHDNGAGISASDQRRIFETFYRSENVSSRAQGTGLGLAICQSLVELHGGRIWVESGPREGTTFKFVLPKSPTAA